VAIRPCAVYGIDPRIERSHGYRLVEKIRRGHAIDKPGGGKFVHVDDVAAATVASLAAPGASGRPLNLVDCYARWADWALMAREILGAEVAVDDASPAEPRNTFTKDHLGVLGLEGGFVSRGHAGIRRHLGELIEAMGRRA
jgi:nucleoside-diphosphate-sugar epimerase